MILPLILRRAACTSFFATAVLALSSCTGPVLRDQFKTVNAAYADALNAQMLLNLARLDNGHPAYYLAIGSINNRYVFGSETSAGSTVSDTDSTTLVGKQQRASGVMGLVESTATKVGSTVLGGSFGQKVTVSSSPDFQFIPLNNETVARQLLEPISTEVFFALYQQGYPIDHLLRVMIERIETTVPDTGEELVLVNSPVRGTAESFGRFLRTCAILREMQRTGSLLLEARIEFETLGPVALTTTGAAKANPNTKEFIDTMDRSLLLRQTNGAWEIGRNRSMPTFFLRADRSEKIVQEIGAARIADHDAVRTVVKLLGNGITVKTRPESSGQAKTRLILRSFARVMDAVASEQNSFDALLKIDEIKSIIPPVEQQPVLRTRWESPKKPLCEPVETIRYAGKRYAITDPVADPLDPNEKWNRDVFRLLVALGSQVTVDISKFQRHVLELQ
jgi:hypothetical protein